MAIDQAHELVRSISSWEVQTYIFWALSSTYSCICGNTENRQKNSIPELNLSSILVPLFWSFNRHRGMFLLTLTMSDVMVFSGISLGSCMWTSCSSATIHGKSWGEKDMDVMQHKYRYKSLQKIPNPNRKKPLEGLEIQKQELICRFTVFLSLTLMTWTFSMLRVAASLVCTRTVNEHPVPNKKIGSFDLGERNYFL